LDTDPRSPRVFISHSHTDDAFTMRLSADLREAGADIWVDIKDLDRGDFLDRINQALSGRDYLLFVQTPASLHSKAVQAEVNAAIHRTWQGRIRGVIPIIAASCDPDDIPPMWGNLHYYDATEDYAAALAGLIQAIGLVSQHAVEPQQPQTLLPSAGSTSSVSTPSPIAGPRISRRALLVASGAVVATAGAVGLAVWLHGSPKAKSTATGPSLVWRYRLGGQVGPPTLGNETVFVGSDDKILHALRALDATPLWSTTLPAAPAGSTVADSMVYVGTDDGRVWAFHTTDGTEAWHYRTGAPVRGGITVADGVLYCGSDDGYIYALGGQTGQLLWRYLTGAKFARRYVEAAPTVQDGTLFVGAGDFNMYALVASMGAVTWIYKTSGRISGAASVVNGAVYFGAWDNTVYALDATSGILKWRTLLAGPIGGNVSIANGMAYLGSYDHTVYALDSRTGAIMWRGTTGDAIAGSVAVVDDLIVAGSGDGKLYAFEAHTGQLMWTYATGGAIIRSVIHTAEDIYFGSNDGYLYALRG
jgi:outer membrane protein assembly factor BamB